MPTIPTIISVRKNICNMSEGSLKIIMPAITPPAAPMPVQTAYDTPRGRVRMAKFRSRKLVTIATTITADGTNFVNPSDIFRETAHTISSNPAIIKYNQAIVFNINFKNRQKSPQKQEKLLRIHYGFFAQNCSFLN